MSDYERVFVNPTADQSSWKEITIEHEADPPAVRVSLEYAWPGVTTYQNPLPAQLRAIAKQVEANQEAADLLEHLAGKVHPRPED